jgi:arylsulfatase A-like enzyme/Tfp pilus assembly protein PilF
VARPLRFTVILALAALATALAAAGGWRYARASAPVNGPIILISLDPLGAGRLAVFGGHTKTPAIDALAADGTVFERAYSHSPQALPAYTTLLSGRLPFETGVRDEVGFTVKRNERLLPQMLRERGYSTAGIVSTSRLRRETGISQGFDFYDDEIPGRPDDSFSGVSRRDDTDSEAIAERWLDEQTSSRLFLFLQLDGPNTWGSPAAESDPQAYDAALVSGDEVVGRLTRYLKAHQQYDRSTIILLSAHGAGLGSHGEREHGLLVYEDLIHVPLIVKQSGGLGGGRRMRDIVQHVDLVPTILDLAKAPRPDGLPGRSLRPLFEDGASIEERLVYSEAGYGHYHFGWSGLASLTSRRFQFIAAPRVQLYDLTRDPGETADIAADKPDVRISMQAALDALRPGAQVDGSLPDPQDKIATVERYRAALALADGRQWASALNLLQQILKADPNLVEVWQQLAGLASRMERWDVTADAYRHLGELNPEDGANRLGEADSLLKQRKFEESQARAQEVVDEEGASSPHALAAHEILARVALARRDATTARQEAELVRQASAQSPLPAYVEGRLLYDQGMYEAALPFFEEAAAADRAAVHPLPDLHFLTADTLVRLDRASEAEEEFIEELRGDPQNARARAGLATLYQKTGRTDEASQVLDDLLATTPTPAAYALAAGLWTSFGDRRHASAVRAEARTAFQHLP